MENILKKIKIRIQTFGGGLSSMIMPIIGIFIAWGLLTSFFIPTGWIPNEQLATMVGVGIIYIIPVLICFLGGFKIYQYRGGAIAGIAAIAAISAGQSSIFAQITGGSAPMLLSVMIFGPLSAWILKHSEKFWINKIPSGYQMLINNFYLGILGFILLFPIYYISIYGVGYLIKALGIITSQIGEWKAYPLVALIVEPAKILFLNNAINHGVFTTLGSIEVTEHGKSILFLLESNPGPGLGLLVFYLIFGKDKSVKSQAGSSIPIHFFGGIHEVYFPFALLRPILIIALILGGAFGNAMFQLFGVGAVAPVSPGSIIAQYIQVEKTTTSIIGLTIGIFGSAIVSFLAALGINFLEKLLKRKQESISLEQAQEIIKDEKSYKNKGKIINYDHIVFACDAGMGSSVMAASIFKKMLKEAQFNSVEVTNSSISNLSGDEQVIITIESLQQRVYEKNPSAKIITLDQFLNKQAYEKIIAEMKANQ
ncbi:PTS system mannitol-specific (MtlA)-like IIB domain protein [Mesomycoplasma conjunctivae]|uniref:PTS system mannitol-specific EIICB component n=1 Tax=Mesomycoplasma conjunctivae (strain ATCC 25834 / NCTC 10147 / HRC/581) TaxID=572263 RepID=C5J773_MESCH|nr:PTS mannitol transporter subunit IICB [Mesomycoplasma conjunctivae]CAT05336.1 PTS system, mannitol-specific IIBC component [Mesomycoplasma conjunctivae]VEU66561.1 PTS system mannitol-specific (MtlA)-like IIB domain protein [Mesomycoplasma conjunctivae]